MNQWKQFVKLGFEVLKTIWKESKQNWQQVSQLYTVETRWADKTTNYTVCPSVRPSVSQLVYQSVSQSVSQSASLVSQSVSQSVSQFSQSVSQSVSLVSQSVSQFTYQPTNLPINQPIDYIYLVTVCIISRISASNQSKHCVQQEAN